MLMIIKNIYIFLFYYNYLYFNFFFLYYTCNMNTSTVNQSISYLCCARDTSLHTVIVPQTDAVSYFSVIHSVMFGTNITSLCLSLFAGIIFDIRYSTKTICMTQFYTGWLSVHRLCCVHVCLNCLKSVSFWFHQQLLLIL